MADDYIKKLFYEMGLIDRIYDSARLVDPIGKRIISFNGNSRKVINARCFDFWNKSKACDNCISIRALNDDAAYIKFEYTETKVFMITAIPFEMHDRRAVIEMLKDVTDTMSLNINRDEDNQKAEIYALIENMNNFALKDSLTGMYNRRYINEKLPVDFINSALLDQEISLIMADIDYFKNVNDTYGHLTGDHVLKTFADTLSSCIKRSSDWVARFGGEEFLICLPGADLIRATQLAEKMRKATEEKVVVYNQKNIRVTASFGVFCVKASSIENIELLIKHADEKLYLAKMNGRNRIEF